MMGFVAVLRRCPLLGWVKVARCPGQMGAMPIITTVDNMRSYLRVWPKRFSSYLAYGGSPTILDASSKRLTMIAVADAPMANAAASAGVDAMYVCKGGRGFIGCAVFKCESIIVRDGQLLISLSRLVGDSLGQTALGLPSTTGVNIGHMIHHTSAVRRGIDASNARAPLLVADMPFGSTLTPEIALRDAARLMQEAGADAVKVEVPLIGAQLGVEICRRLAHAGIAVVGHIGLTPQTHVRIGGFRIQGRTSASAFSLLQLARDLSDAGACIAIVLECVPAEVAGAITAAVAAKSPTIGIGSGIDCSGQVLVANDILGITERPPKLARAYVQCRQIFNHGFVGFIDAVRCGLFPGPGNTTHMKPAELHEFRRLSCHEPAADLAPTIPPVVDLLLRGSDSVRVLIIGGGAMGSLLAGWISQSRRNHVVLVSDHRTARDALVVGGVTCPDVRIVPYATESFWGDRKPADIVFVAGKNAQVDKQAVVAATALQGGKGVCVAIQNGVGALERLRGRLPSGTVVAQFLTSIGAKYTDDKSSVQVNTGATSFATLVADSPIVSRALADWLQEAADGALPLGQVALRAECGPEHVWRKLAASCAINAPTALWGVTRNGDLLDACHGQAALLVRGVVDEVVAVAKAAGVGSLPGVFDEVISILDDSKGNTSSMQADLLRGNRTEIDDINGFVVRTAMQLGVNVPLNAALYAIIKTIEVPNDDPRDSHPDAPLVRPSLAYQH